MRNAILLVLRELGDALAELGQKDDGVVAETALPSRSAKEFTGAGFLDDEDALFVEDQGEGADEGATPVLEAFAVFEEEGVALDGIEFAPSILGTIAGRKHAGSASHGVDGEARIVGEGWTPGKGVEGPGLDQGILDIGCAVLLDIKGRMPDIRGTLEEVSGKEGAEFDELMRVAGGDKEFHAPRLACAPSPGQVRPCFLR